ncbi:MAG: metallophosphoesterase [Planctomycetota bacterium]
MSDKGRSATQTRREFLWTSLATGGTILSGTVAVRRGEAQDRTGEVPRFRFAHVTDMHLSTQGKNGAAMKADSIRIFEDVVEQLNATAGLDFILFGGDNFDNSEKGTADLDEFLRLTAKLKAPYYIQFGNREASSLPPGDPVSKQEFVKAFQGRGFDGDCCWWSASPAKGVAVIGLDTSIEGRNNGAVSEEQLAWLKRELDERRNDFVMVLTHHLFLPTWRPKEIPKWEESYVIGNAEAVMPILEKASNVKLVLSGHHHVAKVQVRNGLPYIASPATVQYPHAFRVVSVEGGEAKFDFRQIRSRDIIASGRQHLIEAKADEYGKGGADNVADYCLGAEGDRTPTLDMR